MPWNDFKYDVLMIDKKEKFKTEWVNNIENRISE